MSVFFISYLLFVFVFLVSYLLPVFLGYLFVGSSIAVSPASTSAVLYSLSVLIVSSVVLASLTRIPFRLSNQKIKFISLKPSFGLLFLILSLAFFFGFFLLILSGIDLSSLEITRLTIFFQYRYFKIIPLGIFAIMLLSLTHITSKYTKMQLSIISALFFSICSLFYYRQLFGLFSLAVVFSLFSIRRISLRVALLVIISLSIVFIGWNLLRSGSSFLGIRDEYLYAFNVYLNNAIQLSLFDQCIDELLSQHGVLGFASIVSNLINTLNFFTQDKLTTSQMMFNSCLTETPISYYKLTGGGATYGILPELIFMTGSRSPFVVGLFLGLFAYVMCTIISLYTKNSSTFPFSVLLLLLLLTSIFDFPIAISRAIIITVSVQLLSLVAI